MKTLPLLFALMLPVAAFAQQKQGKARLDSLLDEVVHLHNDSTGVSILSSIAGEWNSLNLDSGLEYGRRELALARRIGWRKGEFLAHQDVGQNYFYRCDYPSALESYFKALSIAEERKLEHTSLLFGIGNVYAAQKNYPKALDYYNQVLKAGEQQQDQEYMMAALSGTGNVYADQGRFDDALACNLRALKIAEALGDEGSTLVQIANIGANYGRLGRYPEAIAYCRKALRKAQALGEPQMTATNLGNTGEFYLRIAQDTRVPKPDSLVAASRAANLAKAIDYLNQSIAASHEAQFPEGIREYSEDLSDALTLQGDFRGALAAYRQSVAAKDSLFSVANNEKISNLETQRAIALKDKDLRIAALQKRSERILFAAGAALLLLILGMALRSASRQRRYNALLLREKQRSEDLLLNILPAGVADELKETGAAHARHYDEVSVLFTDFAGFTGMAEQLDPQALVQELHECFTAFDAIAERHGLEKIKTIGDAYMAVCGLPQADAAHAQKTVRAALDIRDFIAERKQHERVFEVRIGIHSGPVVAGIVGVKKFAYDIWGDTVNTAARMEQSGEPGRVNISQATYELVKDAFLCEPRGKVSAKSKGEVEMYFVEGPALTPLD